MQAALLAAKEDCDEACRDPFAPGAEETQVTRAQLSAAARQVRPSAAGQPPGPASLSAVRGAAWRHRLGCGVSFSCQTASWACQLESCQGCCILAQAGLWHQLGVLHPSSPPALLHAPPAERARCAGGHQGPRQDPGHSCAGGRGCAHAAAALRQPRGRCALARLHSCMAAECMQLRVSAQGDQEHHLQPGRGRRALALSAAVNVTT